ncbi:MAG TPA: SEC-C metal-binding domain-containing protein [Phycisphaerae bacterium]|nr:SEC-C metal-binding domain-containing protein [Phycisphaerae bacterium]HRR84303.1 SEC-C metal-binding domain-containing protein [Phycisphaerae bacterium]
MVDILSVPGLLLRKVFGTRNERLLKRLGIVADRVLTLEEEIRQLAPEQLRAKTDEFKKRLADGEPVASVLPEAFAVLREASDRAQKHRHFHCQVIGGQVLYQGNVAEMRTGEGKTIVCHLAAYMKFLQGKKAHIVTVNDYLVRRDAEFAKPIFELLGATVGFIQAQVDPGGHEGIRQAAYACDITYGTNSEFGFDYLRDNMKIRYEDQVQGRLDYAIVDEVDSILIDEARTPLIISGPAHGDVGRYKWADSIARSLVRQQQSLNNETARRISEWGDNPPEHLRANPKFEDAIKRFRVDPYMLTEDEAEAIGHRQLYVVQQDRKQVQITHEGVQRAQDEAGIGSFYVGENMECPHLIENALRAHVVYERDKEYVVQDRQVIIVDEFTGRLMHGRQWSDGLHQAVEAKEGVPVKEETQTMATITIQNFCKLYEHLAGMTGTAMTESEEFMKIYKLEVVAIPTNRPVNRLDHNDRIYRTFKNKYEMIVEEIHEMHRRGRPNDPFLLAEVFNRLKPIIQETPDLSEDRRNEQIEAIEQALQQFRDAENGDTQVTRAMMETYDRVMGNLATGRPILVGTTSVENSERLSQLLIKTYGIEHEVLNAKNHAREAEIVAKAGHRHEPTRGTENLPLGNVTIATNMAGRGTDIKLEEGVVYGKCKVPQDVRTMIPEYPAASLRLFPPGSTKCCINCPEYNAATACSHCFKPKLDSRFPAMGRHICSLNAPCGLHIVGSERHEARRIDNQLRGRAGRQGDPGSSRFFLSLEDDLLKLFMPEWMLKMMERLGFTEGVSLEDKRISKGIERAQRKVEERNFSIRKHLLEWDEPMDYQRRAFYKERQQILEGRQLSDLIWRMIEETVEEAVADYLAEDYMARRISDWCKNNLDVAIDAEVLEGDDAAHLQRIIREKAKDEIRDAIRTSLGEYIDEEEGSAAWDVGGLLKWAQRMFPVSTTQNQLRKMTPAEIEDLLTQAADAHYDQVDLSAIEAYLDPQYARRALADWARNKFGIAIKADEIAEGAEEKVKEVIYAKVREAYTQREIYYPVETVLKQAFGSTGTDNVYACQAVVGWANAKYQLGWNSERFVGRPIKDIADELVQAGRDFLEGGRLEHEIDGALSRYGATGNGELYEWARKRFGKALNEKALRSGAEEPREVLLNAGRQLARWELTQLERWVLLRIYDQGWKDHLLEMDHLKHAIMQRPLGGDQTHPQSQYAIEGREQFRQMWKTIRERVTDMIFKVSHGQAGEGAEESRRTSHLEARHDSSVGAGFAGASEDQQAAMRAQGEGAKPVTIRREAPKVGRNDPCPCGSGKKYKQCHGRKEPLRRS